MSSSPISASSSSSPPLELDKAALFDAFVAASTFKTTLSSFYQMCTALDIELGDGRNVYPRLREYSYWKAQKLWKLLDKRVEQAVYLRQRAAEKLNALVVGAGPCGLRSAIELALLGARVAVVEERDKFSRNNVLHLWEFVIHDLKSLGAKIFYPKFCAGSIEHISIRQLQCSLLKTALCLGVQVHESVGFVKIKVPTVDENGATGFRAILEPAGHILSEFDIDVLIGADGKRNTINGFPRKEMRGRLAIGITANFVNKKTAAEERVPEISGVAYIFNQEFFKSMNEATGVDLENIVYYKDETHYFVMTAKKQSLLRLGVIKKDHEDISVLLSAENVDRDALANYAFSAADFATEGKLPLLEFAKNHRGHPDVAMFDFTSLFSSRCAVRLVKNKGKNLLVGIVGDSLHEPFWPTGSGCARGFLGVLDTAWLVREYGLAQRNLLEILAERESIYRLLAQATKDNLHKAMSKYTIDPRTRYVSLEMSLQPSDVVEIICSDETRKATISDRIVLNRTTNAHVEPAELLTKYGVLRFVQIALVGFKLKIFDFDLSWRNGRALAALIYKFRPDCFDYATVALMEDTVERVEIVTNVIEETLQVARPCTPKYWPNLSVKRRTAYLTDVVEAIRKDSDVVATCIITPRAHSLKRRNVEPLKITVNPKKSGAIAELSASLFGRSLDEDFIVGVTPVVHVQIETQRYSERLARLSNNEELREMPVERSPSPRIEKLNPDLVEKVKKIVSGEHQKENMRDIHDRKVEKVVAKISRLDAGEIAELENRLLKSPSPGRPENLSSQEEKIVRVKAAEARREAENGFTKEHETRRFQMYDDVIRDSERAAKRRDLVGIDPFKRQRRATTAIILTASPVAPPPTTPQKSFTIENGENGAVLRPIASVTPKRQASTTETMYDSLNPRKQELCKLCEKVVYLAERIQVGAIYVHRNCFRCAYCSQALRIGAYCTDKDLEYHYPNRLFYYCRTHMQIPLREKISRIGRIDRAIQRKRSSDEEENVEKAIASVSAPVLLPSPPPIFAGSPPRQQSKTTLSFYTPEPMLVRAHENAKEIPMTAVLESAVYSVTPERAEFGAHTRTSRPASQALNYPETVERVTLDEESTSDSEEDDFAAGKDLIDLRDPKEQDAVDDEEELEDELEDEDVAELERTINEMAETRPNQQFSSDKDKDELVKTVLERINHRRSSILPSPRHPFSEFKTPRQHSVQDEEMFYTPAVSFRTRDILDDEEIRGRAVSIAVDSSVGNYEQYMTPCASDIQKDKINALEKLRIEARQRAKLKTDEQLGIEATAHSQEPTEEATSVPKMGSPKSTTPHLTRANTVSPPSNRVKVNFSLAVESNVAPAQKVTERASSLLEEMPSLFRATAVTVESTPTTPTTPTAPPLPTSTPPSLMDEAKADVGLPPKMETPKRALPPQKPPAQGLLATLFSPEAIRKPVVHALNPERLKCESKKEASILDNPMRKLRQKRAEIAHSRPSEKEVKPLTILRETTCEVNGKVPCVAVAPSPRKTAPTAINGLATVSQTTSIESRDGMSSPGPNARTIQKRAEKIIRQREEERRRTEQDLQRGLEECEVRLETLCAKGREYELKLLEKPSDTWLLDCWNALVQEQSFLKWRQESLMLRKQQLELEKKYKELNVQLQSLDIDQVDDDSERRQDILREMVRVVDEKKEAKTHLEASNQLLKASAKAPADRLVDIRSDFRNATPVFIQQSSRC